MIDTSVATKWFLLCAVDSDEAGEARELTPEQADDLNGRLAVRNQPWRWVQFSERGESAA